MIIVLICYFTDAVSPPSFVLSEKSPSLQTNVSLDKKSESTITNTVIENPLQTPLEKQSAGKSFETLTALPAFWPSNQEELISPNLRLSKSDSTFYNQASVETLYVSPSFNVFDPVKEMVINKDCQKPAESSVVQMEEENLKTLTAWGESTKNHKQKSLFKAFFFYFLLLSVSFFCSLLSLCIWWY